jgi:alpha-1,2-mannosyltransferase
VHNSISRDRAPVHPPSRPVPGRRTLLTVAAVAGVLAAVVGIIRSTVGRDARTYHVDFDVYRAGGRAVLDGQPLYEGLFHVAGIDLPFTYPPLSALVFAPLAALPDEVGYYGITVLNLLATVLTVVIVLRSLAAEAGRRLSGPRAWFCGVAVLPVAVWLWPVTHTLEYGQINILLMLLVVADLLLPRTPWPRGTLIGLAAALKLTPAVFGLMFLLRRQWREAATSLGSGVVFSALAWLVLPGDSHRYWFSTLSDPTRIGDLAYAANQSVRGTLARFVDDPVQSRLWLVVAAVTLVAVAVVMVRQLAVGAVTAAVCTNALLALLASPVSWAHHWVWVLPMLVGAVAGWWRTRHRLALGLPVVLGLVSTALPLHLYLPAGHGAETDWPVWMRLVAPAFVWCGVLWLVVTGRRPDLVSVRPTPEEVRR